MPEQTLPEFLYTIMQAQNKNSDALVEALKTAAKNIDELSAQAKRSEENRQQVETLLERQSTVESDLKFDLTQCRQHNEVLQGQVRTLEESLRSTDAMLAVVTRERDNLSKLLEQSSTVGTTQLLEILKYRDEIATLKLQLAAGTLDCVVPAETPPLTPKRPKPTFPTTTR